MSICSLAVEICKTNKTIAISIIIPVILLFQCSVLYAANKKPLIGILYPEVSKKYNYFFKNIIKGIKENTLYNTVTLKTSSDTSNYLLNQWIKHHNIDAIITLGQSSYKLAHSSKHGLPVIAGGLVASPNGITGISLSGDPEAFFKQLKKIAPKIKRVHIVYNEKNNGWLIKKAIRLTGKYNIGLVTYPATDIHSATIFYKKILKNINSEDDSIWIPLDNIAPINTLLPMILKESWDKKIIVFSNNLQHTKRGVLFSLYPDHIKSGKRLIDLLNMKLLGQINKPKLLSTINLKTAVNARTASHLGLKLQNKSPVPYDQIYPSYK